MIVQFRRAAAGFLLCCCAGLAAAATRVQSAGLEYQIDKLPAWVTRIAGPNTVPPALAAAGATQLLLVDRQVNLLGAKPVSFVHMKSTALERSGLEHVSSLRISFNPRYESLVLHELVLHRDGKRIDQLKTARINLAQRESRLDEGIYDEDVEAIVALADVRVGDVVEYAYSISGDNPVFGGRYSQFFSLNRDVPVVRLDLRIVHPATRTLYHRLRNSTLEVRQSEERGARVLSLGADNLTPVRPEHEVPAWAVMYPWLQVTEFASWQDVNAWAAGLYALPRDLSPEIEAVVEKIRAEGGTPEEMAVKALAWVQGEIRYYSVAVGTSSHRPNHPNLTVRQRFGDCKDKSVLLAAMLQRLGLTAEPALVSQRMRRGVADWLPTALLFDHVIVRLRIGEQTYWLDGTATHQGTVLPRLGFTAFGKALPAVSPVTELAAVEPPMAWRVDVETSELFRVSRYGAPAVLEMTQTFHGAFAEWFRRRLAADGVKRLVEGVTDIYGKSFPGIAAQGSPTVSDDPAENRIALVQSFTVPQLFSYENGRAKTSATYARSLLQWIRFPGTPERRFPLALPYPGSFEHRLVLELPAKPPFNAPTAENRQDKHLAMSTRYSVEGAKVGFTYSLRALRDHVAAADYPAFAEKLQQHSNILFSSLTVPLIEPAAVRARLVRDFEAANVNLRKPDKADSIKETEVRNFALADEAIRTGLLAGKALAVAYRDRGEAASALGRHDDGLVDVERAIELDEDEAKLVLKGQMELFAGRYRAALGSFARVRQDADKPGTLIDVGTTQFMLGDYAEAQKTFARAAEAADDDNLPYALTWLALSARRAGGDARALVARHRSRLGTAWMSNAVTYMIDETDADALLAAARQDEKESRLRLCEAYFFLGHRALQEGRLADARRWFDKSVDTNAVMYREHIFSRHELKKPELR